MRYEVMIPHAGRRSPFRLYADYFNYDIMKVELRYAAHPDDVKNWDTTKLRKEFLIENIFEPDEIYLVVRCPLKIS
jgi:hypothetical protein